MILEGMTSGTVSLDHPNVRILLEACASSGLGTTGLNTKNCTNSVKKTIGEGGPAGGRKSPAPGGNKKTVSPGGNGGGGTKKGTVTKVAVVSGGGVGNGVTSGSKKSTAAAPATANGEAKKSGGGGGSSGGKGKGGAAAKGDAKSAAAGEASKGGGPKSPKSPMVHASPPTSGSKAKRTVSKPLGKPGLAVPTTLYPELVRLIEKGGEFQRKMLDAARGLSACVDGRGEERVQTGWTKWRRDLVDVY